MRDLIGRLGRGPRQRRDRNRTWREDFLGFIPPHVANRARTLEDLAPPDLALSGRLSFFCRDRRPGGSLSRQSLGLKPLVIAMECLLRDLVVSDRLIGLDSAKGLK